MFVLGVLRIRDRLPECFIQITSKPVILVPGVNKRRGAAARVPYHSPYAHVTKPVPSPASMLPLLCAVVLATGASTLAHAQRDSLAAFASLSNLRADTLGAGDTLRFAPGSLFVRTLTAARLGDTSGAGLPIVTATPGRAYLAPGALPDTAVAQLIVWRYRAFETDLRRPVARIDSSRLRNRGPIASGLTAAEMGLSLSDLRRELGAVDYRGTFGRGLRFGNSQSLVLDSRLDLQLDGDLGDGLSISAVVSDQNIPLQPEGNTVQLQEFDRIFVTVAKDKHALTAGDYSLRSADAHFLRFDKNLQGLTYRYNAPVGPRGGNDDDDDGLSGGASVAAARGQFTRIQLPVDDGNQGPYRLSGASNQPFVIVLAGTERVTLDGRLLERGIDRDYTIDYNRGEVTFMPRLLVNRFQRILVEYEYVDREYLRSLASAEARYAEGPWTFYVTGLQQQDGLRRTGGALSEAAEAALRDAPGTVEGVLVPSESLLPDDTANPIGYRRVASPAPQCSGDSVFVFAAETTDEPLFTVSFTEVGAGQGDYVLSRSSSANGPIFEYLARGDACEPRGNYAPVRRVQTPQALRLLTFGGRLDVDTSFGVSWELVGSQTDANRYNATQRESVAGHFATEKTWRLGRGRLVTGLEAEGTGADFEAIAPWRAPEFNRSWNLGNLAQQQARRGAPEQLATAHLGYLRARSALDYRVHHYAQEGSYNGLRQNWLATTQAGRWRLRHTGEHLDAVREGERTGKLDLSVGAATRRGAWEHSLSAHRLTSDNYDVVRNVPAAIDREVAEWSVGSARAEVDSLWTPRVRYSGRVDWLRDGAAGGDGLRTGDGLNHQVEVGLASPARRRNGLDLTATYRYAETPGEAPERYYLGRVAHRYRGGKSGWVSLQTTAEAGSGQERRVALQYLRVQPGLGQYVWRDYDGDGVEDLGEFEVAVFADSAAYIRTTLLTDEFVATNTLGVNQSVNVDLGRRPKLRGKFFGRFSALNTASLRRRAIQGAGYTRLLALDLPEADTTVVGDDLAWRSALYFNRARNAFRAELEHRQLSNRNISLQGLQQLRTNGLALRLLLPLGRAWRLTGELDRERRRSRNAGFAERTFTLEGFTAEPGLRFQPNPNVRATLTASYREGEAVGQASGVVARGLSLEADLRLPEVRPGAKKKRRLAGASLRARVRRVDQRFRGEADSPAGFALLEGLKPGRSWIWDATVDQRLGRALQLSLRYEGRQLGEGRVIHAGQAQLQAVF